jgi:hypothetical protein
MKPEVQKDPNRKAVFHFPGGPEKLCYRSLQRSLNYTHLRPAEANLACLPEDLASGDLFRISESEDEMQGIFKDS